MGAFTTRWR